jgi:3-hydroxybutyrate dehydrogenase
LCGRLPSMKQLQGKRALVTGGGRGIGEACARALAAAGAHVVVTGRNAVALDKVASDVGGTAMVIDLSSRIDFDRALGALHGQDFDIIVNNAGIAMSATAPNTSDAMWDQMMEVNVTAPFRIIRALLPGMITKQWGRIVNIASNAGVSGYQYTSAYCASKHALVGLTRGLAMDVARFGVTANAVCPGWVDTDMAQAAISNVARKTKQTAQDARAQLADMSPQRRLMESDEVAYVTVMLCGHGARGINGQAMVIDGGQILK